MSSEDEAEKIRHPRMKWMESLKKTVIIPKTSTSYTISASTRFNSKTINRNNLDKSRSQSLSISNNEPQVESSIQYPDLFMETNEELEYSMYGQHEAVGHTQMECDSVHASIERKLKNREIHLPSEYAKVTKEARIKPFPYEVKILDYTFFKNYASQDFQIYSSIRPGRKKGDPCVTDIRMLKYDPKGNISVKLDFDGNFIDLPQRPKQRRREQDCPALYQNRLNLAASKWKHLQELKFALPQEVHSFYDELPHFD